MNPDDDVQLPTLGASAARAPRRRAWIAIAMVGLIALGAIYFWLRAGSGGTGAEAGGRGGRGPDAGRPVPVSVQAVVSQALEHTLSALGTVTARSTITVRSQVDGQLTQVAFREGQLVHAGDLLAQIDPRPFEAALANARAQLERDDAQLQNALVDLERYRGLSAEDSIPKQQLDTQDALVRQLRGTVNADRAQIETAQLNLTYSHVSAPVSGRVGLRQVDAGNVVHASDANGLVVITEVQPIDIVFPIPQDYLPVVLQRMQANARLAVDAFDRDGKTLLGTGHLRSIDNLIDPTTGTVKLKAEFANTALALFPNQFVNVRLHLETIAHAVTVPAAAVQRGAPGLYVYLVQADGSVSMRTPKLGITEGDRVQVLEGLAPGDRVVVDGTDKLRDGAKVEAIDSSAQPGADHTADKGSRGHRSRDATKGPPDANDRPSGSGANARPQN